MSERAKVVFPLQRDESEYATESVWAERLAENRFLILNSPFFVFGVSYEDVVEAEPDGEIFRFVRVLQKRGRSTYRVILQGGRTIEGADFVERWQPFHERGCTYESANDKYIAVDMPPNTDVPFLYRLLQDGEAEGVWIFEEGYYAGVQQ
jgi:hypothetical protein